ncbi:MAG: phytanoyl-CoA dioxygenase [Betaproteobacteria bacterium]|nr:MAG: phytanoyl-CoA dioxygenase [Betaproteobacteria bacterium]
MTFEPVNEADRSELSDTGSCQFPRLLRSSELTALRRLTRSSSSAPGNRAMLSTPWCAALGRRLANRVPDLIGMEAVQCTLFEKSALVNWLVPPHQDLQIPVNHGQMGALKREGIRLGLGDSASLVRHLALRVHLDECGLSDGPLRVYPSSHRNGVIPAGEVLKRIANLEAQVQTARPGDAWLLSPLLVHTSSKASGASRRRVLHYLYRRSD